MKTARFTEVVKAGGAPETYLLWVPAEKDKTFQRALREHRIMTVHRELRGAKKEFGTVGFHKAPIAQWLMFPKSLRRFEDRRIVGINYDLMAKPNPAQLAAAEKAAAKAAARKSKRATEDGEITDQKIVKFEQPEPARSAEAATSRPTRPEPTTVAVDKPKTEKPPKISRSKAAPVRRMITTIEKAMKELKAGKAVLAYGRLESLVEEMKAGSE